MTNEHKEIGRLEDDCNKCLKACKNYSQTKSESDLKTIIKAVEKLSHEEFVEEKIDNINKELMKKLSTEIRKTIIEENDFENEEKIVIKEIEWIKEMKNSLEGKTGVKINSLIGNIYTKTKELLDMLTKESNTNQTMKKIINYLTKIISEIKKEE